MGYEKPNYTQVPNMLLDDHLSSMGEAELKVVLAVARKTFGWHKERDRLSLTQLEALTGLSRQGVIDGTTAAINRGVMNRIPLGNSFSYELTVKPVDQDSQASRPLDGQASRHTKETLKETIQKKTTAQSTYNNTRYVPEGQEFEEKQQRSTSDPRNRHPAAKLYRTHMHLYVNRDWLDDVIRIVGNQPESLLKWQGVLKSWNGKGWKPGNIEGLLDAFQNGGIGKQRNATAPQWLENEERARLVEQERAKVREGK